MCTGLVPTVALAGLAGASVVGRYPTSSFCPPPAAAACSTLYSAASVVNGTSWNWASLGWLGPE